MLKWVKAKGGISKMAEVNREKAQCLYKVIDECDFYHCPIVPGYRSDMNVTFCLANESLNQRFLDEAKAQGLVALKGHRSIGGMRASIYNAMPLEGVVKLASFMKSFALTVEH